MKRIRCLGRYQKGILLLMAVMVSVFAVVYAVTIARVGFAYGDTILVPNQENDSTIYSGKIHGVQASFTVYTDKTVEFRYGDKLYGPYTAREDSSAIPDTDEQGEPPAGESVTGVELRCGEEIIFRGCVVDYGSGSWLYNEDGSLAEIGMLAISGDGVIWDENGNVIDVMEPSVSAILDLMAGPELTHKGEWLLWFGGTCICILTAFSILFADELFRWNMAFQIRNADQAEPSDWEIASRYIFWTGMPLLALFVFIEGLQ